MVSLESRLLNVLQNKNEGSGDGEWERRQIGPYMHRLSRLTATGRFLSIAEAVSTRTLSSQYSVRIFCEQTLRAKSISELGGSDTDSHIVPLRRIPESTARSINPPELVHEPSISNQISGRAILA
jgi:hypothetical protein